jgi:hypothetical protein
VDLEADPDWEWHSAGEDTPEQLEALWQGDVLRSGSIGPSNAGSTQHGRAGICT